jgi:transcriptional regulator with PAS, ATPase and Fis domain
LNNDEFFEMIRGHAERYINAAVSQKISVIFCSPEGTVTEILTVSDSMASVLASAGIRAGISLAENSAGTNAAAMTLLLRVATICRGPEHYLEKFHQFASVALPLFDAEADFRGALALFGVMPDVDTPALRGVVAMMIQLFDREVRMQRHVRLNDELRQLQRRMFKEDIKPMLMINRNGYVRQMNPAAMKMFEVNEPFFESNNLERKARFSPSLREIAKSAIPCKARKMEITLDDRRIEVNYEKNPIYSEKDEFLGNMIILDEQSESSSRQSSASVAKYDFDSIIGDSPRLRHCKKLALKAAETSVSVFLHGPSGTGKEIFAHGIHNASDRKDEAFVAINCAAIPREIAESELFGYETGAFTGAKKGGNIGKLQAADKGTVFLDEIGDMPLELQAKLLRLLEERTITRIGGRREIPVNIRVIAASNRDIEALIAAGQFREDLYYRLNVTSIDLPPLVESREDIPLLVDYFIGVFNEIMGKQVPGILPDIMQRFQTYSWPGNIRELKNTIEFAVMVNSGEETIAWKHLPGRLRTPLLYSDPQEVSPGDPLGRERRELQESEKALYEKAVKMAGGNLSKAARSLGISRSTIYRKLKSFNIK